jgi:NAD(P)-dependent dehydrogenase (short-subunit alcohol dehydrogenase family)
LFLLGRLEGKVALVTGGSAGIGRETSLLFSAEGASVVVVDKTDAGNETVELIKKNGGKAIFIKADISKEKECQHVNNKYINRDYNLSIKMFT